MHFIKNSQFEYTLFNTHCNPCFIQNYQFDRKVSNLEIKYYLIFYTIHFTIGISQRLKLKTKFLWTIFHRWKWIWKKRKSNFWCWFLYVRFEKEKNRMCHYRSTRWSSLIAPRRFVTLSCYSWSLAFRLVPCEVEEFILFIRIFLFIRNTHFEYPLFNRACNPCFIQNSQFDGKVSKF